MPDTHASIVLVVEDEYFIADDLARALRDAGATVLGPVPNAEMARRIVSDSFVDLVLLDLNLDG
ncbi:hypothetical protein B2G71_21510 [Novosphingobium sp. PC22D]|uniref:response regulator n=1 Tax=Novosphingobium sp. PC22D TaxID=1962403 RepID=UPI000BEFA200|nr:response regulator [Novosphingobium sp. PC22D]PEQ10564.1 hypothetical protein B2G71_21510 [Novosphingobium sp. PC22D]